MDYTARGILRARVLEWVAIPFSSGSAQPRDGTQVSHTAGGFFTVWAAKEAQTVSYWILNIFYWYTCALESQLLKSLYWTIKLNILN